MKQHFQRYHSNIFDNEEMNEAEQKNEKIWVKKYSTEIEKNVYQCDICQGTIKLPGKAYGNLKRHFFGKHPNIYKMEQINSSNKNNVEIVNTENCNDSSKINAQDSVVSNKEKNIFGNTWVKSYSTEIEKNVFQCDICHARIKLPGKAYGNLKRHFCSKHPKIYEKEQLNNLNQGIVEMVYTENSNIEHFGMDSSESGNDSSEKNAQDSIVIIKNNMDSSESGNESSEKSAQDSVIIKKNIIHKRIWVKSYSTEIDKDLYQCHICKSTIRLPGKAYGNLKRHFRKKHPVIYEMEEKASSEKNYDIIKNTEKSINTEDRDENLSEITTCDSVQNIIEEVTLERDPMPSINCESDFELEQKIKDLCEKTVMGKIKTKTCFWNFATVVEKDYIYKCLFCDKDIVVPDQSVSNIKRHIRLRHKTEFSIIQKYASKIDKVVYNTLFAEDTSKEDFQQAYFDIEDDDTAKCKICGEVVNCCDEKEASLFIHIQTSHPDEVLLYEEDPLCNESDE